jgi:hypothetical protein
MHASFKEKFVDYLTNGLPIHIPDDEVTIFYKVLSDFIEKADNEFEGYYLKEDGYVLIADKYTDYLKVSYKDNKIIFQHANSVEYKTFDSDTMLQMGLAFIGVLVFIESMTPSTDSNNIAPKHYDQWRI